MSDETQSRSSQNGKREHLTALTSVRFFAAFWVLVYHATSELGPLPGVLSGVIKNGFTGVSLFFILSGFVLTYTYAGASASRVEFFRARLARIYPVYFFSLILAAPLFFKAFVAEGHGDKIPALAIGKILMIQSWVPWMEANWNVPSWSLSTEAFFYLLFPLLLRALVRFPARLRFPGMLGMLIVYGFGEGISKAVAPDYSLSPVRDLFLFASGILLGLQFMDGWRAPKWLLAGSFVASVGLIAAFDPIPSNGWIKVALTCSLAGLIAGIASISPRTSNWLNRPLLKRLGEASYALYITHLPLAGIFAFLGSRVGLSFANPLMLVAYIPTAIIFSVLVFNLIEAPANRLLRGRRRSVTEAAPVTP